jgi:GT2 family glycosyltransferase
MGEPRTSIIICTCNRAEHLQQTMDAIRRAELPPDILAEVLVVDNASTDNTHAVVESGKATKMPVRYVFEPRRGKGHAYNTGMAEARGEVFIFTDDDVRPMPRWIEGMCRPILDGQADGVQGGVRIPLHLRRPWMKKLHLELLASTEFVEDEVSYLVGANMAFSRKVLERVPGFDPELGPGALGFLDESLFSMQLKVAGYRLVFAPDAAVEHHFDAARLTSWSFRDRAYRDGQSRAYVAHHWEHETLQDARSEARRLKLALARHYLRHPLALRSSAVMDQGEFWLYVNLGFWRQMTIEQGRPRRYSKHGLALLTVPQPQGLLAG